MKSIHSFISPPFLVIVAKTAMILPWSHPPFLVNSCWILKTTTTESCRWWEAVEEIWEIGHWKVHWGVNSLWRTSIGTYLSHFANQTAYDHFIGTGHSWSWKVIFPTNAITIVRFAGVFLFPSYGGRPSSDQHISTTIYLVTVLIAQVSILCCIMTASFNITWWQEIFLYA